MPLDVHGERNMQLLDAGRLRKRSLFKDDTFFRSMLRCLTGFENEAFSTAVFGTICEQHPSSNMTTTVTGSTVLCPQSHTMTFASLFKPAATFFTF